MGEGGGSGGGGGSYEYRRGFAYVGSTPRFIQQIKEAEEEAKMRREQSRRSQRPVYAEEEPVLVDSEGNALPEELLQSDRRLDSAFSLCDEEGDGSLTYGGTVDNGDDVVREDAAVADERASSGSARKRARMSESVKRRDSPKQLSKLKADTRLLSFVDDEE